MSGEHPNGRKAVDSLARRIVEHDRKQGRTTTHEEARKRATETAIRHDRRKDR